MISQPSFVSAPILQLLKSIVFVLCLLGSLTCLNLSAATKWDPIDPAEWAQTKSKIDPDAGAEIIAEETIVDSLPDNSCETKYHIRIRIYGQRGIESYSKIEIPFLKGNWIQKLESRTVTPDGTITLLDPKDVYEREVVRAGDARAMITAFAPPGIVPNCIIEYRYKQNTSDSFDRVEMVFQHTVPARRVRYRMRLPSYDNTTLSCLSFNCPPQQLKSERGFYNFEMSDLPAQAEEPFSPPPVNIHPVVVLYYFYNIPDTPTEYIIQRATTLKVHLENGTLGSRIIHNTLSTIVAPSDDAETKLRKIYAYCQTKIINRYRQSTDLTSEQRKKFRDNDNASDTLKQGNGTGYDINLAFAALAQEAGMEVRLAVCNDRRVILFNPKIKAPFTLTDYAVAVRNGNGWRYFDPGSTYLPFGELNWQNTDTTSLLSDSKNGETVEIKGPPAEASLRQRVGSFTLDTNGTLDGSVTVTYTGLCATEQRYLFDAQSPEERIKAIREQIQATLKLAEVTEIVIKNPLDPQADLKISYHLHIPAYAERTDSRMFVQPAVFQKNLQPAFSSTKRTNAVMFHYRNTEHDEITIQPPPEFALEAASDARSLDMGAFGNYTTNASIFKKSGKIKYTRQFATKALVVLQPGYKALKAAFDQIHANDNQVLTFKQISRAVISTSEKTPVDQAASPTPASSEPTHANVVPPETGRPTAPTQTP